MSVAQEPSDTAFAVKMLCSAPPPAVGAVDDAEPILDFEFLRLDVDVALAAGTGKNSSSRASWCIGRSSRRVFVGGRLTEFAVPSARRFVVKLGEGSLDSFLCFVAISLLGVVVPCVDLHHALELFG